MPVPKGKRFRCKSPDNILKFHHILYILRGMMFDVEDAKAAIKIIEENNLDKSQFNFPYGSFEEFKKHVLNGAYDVNIDSVFISKEEHQKLDDAVEEGKLWVTY